MKAIPRFLVISILFCGLLNGCCDKLEHAESAALELPSTDQLITCNLGTTRNPHRMGDIILAGQPGEADMEIIAGTGVRTVLNLRNPGEMSDYDEPQAVTAAGMEYINIPFRSADQLTDSVFDEIRRLMRSAQEKILVHCASANRVGAVWIPFRVLDEGIPYKQALAEAEEIGLRSSDYRHRAEAYIRDKQ